MVLLNDGHGHARALQQQSQMFGDPTAAQENDVFHRLLVGAGGDEEFAQGSRRRGDGNPVPVFEDIIAVGNAHIPVPFGGADQHLLAKDRGELGQGDAVETAALSDTEGDDLKLTVGEGVHLGGRGKLQNPGNLLRRHVVRIDGKVEIHDIAQALQTLQILLVAQAHDGVPRTHGPGKLAGHQIGLVVAGGGDEDVSFTGLGLLQHTGCGAVAHAAQHVHGVGRGVQLVALFIDEGDVVPFPAETLGDGVAHLAGACDDDVHGSLLG